MSGKQMKIREILIYVFVIVFMIAALIYTFIFSTEIDYKLIIKAVKTMVAAVFVILCIFVRKNRLQQFDSVFVKEAFAENKRNYNKLMQAIDHLFSKEYSKALKKLQRLEKQCVSNKQVAVVKLFMAMCYHAEKKYDDAVSVYERMLATDGSNAYAWAYLGRVYDERGQRDMAFQAYENALFYQPQNAFVHCCLAYHYMEGLEIEKAYKSMDETLEYNIKRDDVLVIGALYCAFKGDEELAMKFYRRYHGEAKLDIKLKKMINEICKNNRTPSKEYCGNIREFQHLFWL